MNKLADRVCLYKVLLLTALTYLAISFTPGVCVASDFAGCYELKLSPWTPPISLGDDVKYISPPLQIKLTRTSDHTWDPRGMKVVPANGSAPSIHAFSYWTSHGDGVHVVWNTGHAGLTIDFKRRGSNLVGIAKTFWDFARPKQTSNVVATSILCDGKE